MVQRLAGDTNLAWHIEERVYFCIVELSA